MKEFQNEPPANPDEAAVETFSEDFRKRRRALKDVSIEEAARAIERARRAATGWARVSVADRAALLLKTAEILRRHRSELTALILLEVHKNWKEADADVCEAIDFLEYYAREALRIAEKGS